MTDDWDFDPDLTGMFTEDKKRLGVRRGDPIPEEVEEDE